MAIKSVLRWNPDSSMRAYKGKKDSLVHLRYMDEGVSRTGCDSPVGEIIEGQSATLSCPACAQKAQEILIPTGAGSGRV